MFDRIKDLLRSQSIEFREVHHEPTRTSEESAKARGEDLSIGGKGLVLKIDGSFKLFVLSAARKLDSVAIRKRFNTKNIRFATADELMELTGLVPGSVPPFGEPITGLELYCDTSIVNNQKIAYNAGSLTDSIIMSVKDYLAVANPVIFNFSKE
jgi:prolyl-tRNA editing enzyme YbaK/EbsC (Cys-tRNA(Pro) deacylase)